MSRKLGWFVGGGLLVALVLAGVVSNFASSSPDGLEYATREGCETVDENGEETLVGTCMAQREEAHQLADSPFADYGVAGIDNAFLSTGLAGVLGVLATFAVGGAFFWLVRRRRPDAGKEPGAGEHAGAGQDSGASGASVRAGTGGS